MADKRSLRRGALLLALAGVLFAVPVASALLGGCRSGPEKHWAGEIKLPSRPRMGGTFLICTSFWNGTEADRRLASVDFAPALVDGVEILSSSPPWRTIRAIPGGSIRMEFDQPLAPDQTIEVRFEVRPKAAGTITSQIYPRFDDGEHGDAIACEIHVDP
jgi:hypothetical protein